MKLTPEELQAASENMAQVKAECIKVIALLEVPEHIDPKVMVLSTVDGLIAALALIAEGSGMFPSEQERRSFAEQCRTGILKSFEEAREDLKVLANMKAH